MLGTLHRQKWRFPQRLGSVLPYEKDDFRIAAFVLLRKEDDRGQSWHRPAPHVLLSIPNEVQVHAEKGHCVSVWVRPVVAFLQMWMSAVREVTIVARSQHAPILWGPSAAPAKRDSNGADRRALVCCALWLSVGECMGQEEFSGLIRTRLWKVQNRQLSTSNPSKSSLTHCYCCKCDLEQWFVLEAHFLYQATRYLMLQQGGIQCTHSAASGLHQGLCNADSATNDCTSWRCLVLQQGRYCEYPCESLPHRMAYKKTTHQIALSPLCVRVKAQNAIFIPT